LGREELVALLEAWLRLKLRKSALELAFPQV
jgi:hypothetical protein